MGHDEYLVILTGGLGAFLSTVGFIAVWLSKVTANNTLALRDLTSEVKYLHEKFAPMHEMQKEIAHHHQQIASLQEWKNGQRKTGGVYK